MRSAARTRNSDPSSGRGQGRHRGGGGTTLYDSVYLASNELMEKQQGRKAVIVLSDGVDIGSKESLEEAIESAQRANTVVYSILFKDDEAYGNGGGLGRDRDQHSRHGRARPGGMGGPGRGGAAGLPSSMRTAKKFWSECQKKPADGCLKFPRRSPSIRFTLKSRKSCATSTALATTPDREARRVRLSQDSGRSEKERCSGAGA